MSKVWLMKSYRSILGEFIKNEEIGLEEDGIDREYSLVDSQAFFNKNRLRDFDRFCKHMAIGDFVILGLGSKEEFAIKLIGRISSDYSFDMMDDYYRHKRKIEIIKVLEEEVEIDRWASIKSLELIDQAEALENIVRYLV